MTEPRVELRVPADVVEIIDRLKDAGFEAYVVGGCVRDALIGAEPQDWDIATSARPPEIQKHFRRSLYTNRFGTVIVQTREREVEVTTYRRETEYSDHRRPDAVEFTLSLVDDLSRRDFTINAMAWDGRLVDPFGGARDLRARLIRAVGDPAERFHEDALRMLRAVRFAATLDFTIEEATAAAVRANAELARVVSGERVQQEMVKILTTRQPSTALRTLSSLGLLAVILPELEQAKSIPQEKARAQDVFEHSLATLDATPPDDLVLRLAGLLHDIGKPDTFADGHFYQHEYVGEAKARRILRRWKFPKDTIQRVTHLVRNHMFWYQDEWTDAAVRRFIRKVGLDNIRLLFALRKADNIGSGARQPRMVKLDQLWRRVEAELARQNAFSLRDLAIDGHDVMRELALTPGPEVGKVLNWLFERVMDDPELNDRDRLLALMREGRDDILRGTALEQPSGADARRLRAADSTRDRFGAV
jgi:tRNA nucleotidyltransferase (CCA-adding enzyme)